MPSSGIARRAHDGWPDIAGHFTQAMPALSRTRNLPAICAPTNRQLTFVILAQNQHC